MKKRFWHLSSNRWNSAITEYALSAIRALNSVNTQNVFSPLQNSPADARAKKYKIKTLPIKKYSLQALPQLITIAKDYNPSIIIVYGGVESFLTSIISLRLKIPVIRFRGQAFKGSWSRFQFSVHSKIGISHFLTPNQHLYSLVGKITGLPVSCVMLGVDCTKFKFNSEWSHVHTKRPELLIVGRLDPVKGHSFLLKIFSRILEAWPLHLPRPVLKIIGTEANLKKDDLLKLIENCHLKIDEDVQLLLKYTANIEKEMCQASLGVVSSLDSEQICRVSQEFLLCGTPICVSGVGGLEESLFPSAGESYRLNNQEEDKIVMQISKLLQRSYAESTEIRKERSQMASERFSFNKMGDDLDKVANSVLL